MKVRAYNNLIERTYKLEEQTAIQDEKKVVNHRWVMVCSTSLLAGMLSLQTSIAGLPECSVDEDE